MEHVNLTIEGMTCEHCVRAVRGRLEKTDGVKVGDVKVGSATLEYDPKRTDLAHIEEAIADGDGQEFALAVVGYDHDMASAEVSANSVQARKVGEHRA